MKQLIRPGSRRQFLKGMASSTALLVAGCGKTEPPTYGHILRMGDLLTYKAHRLLLPEQSLAREYEHHDITPVMAVGSVNPGDPHRSVYSAEYGPVYEQLQADMFANWRLTIEGSVARPGSYSLADLKSMPSRTQITRHACEEGWSAIAQWTGVPLRHVLEAAGLKPEARYVQFLAYDDIADGVDMLDALHPQTILAYGMNGRDLPMSHGAPLRLRVETQLGYKSMKFLRTIVVTDTFDDHGAQGNIQNGWAWYAGI
jgi:DMSO/TMAO reductase YedYZ molybdopterin-dependent catalytic subunit